MKKEPYLTPLTEEIKIKLEATIMSNGWDDIINEEDGSGDF